MTRFIVVTAFGERLGGSDNILFTTLRIANRERFDPLVVFLGEGSFEREVADLGFRTKALPAGRMSNPGHLAATAARLRRIFKQEQPELILNWLSTAHVYGGLAAAIGGLSDRCIWWQLDMHTGGPFSRGRILDRVATAIPAKAIGACSTATAAWQAEIRPRRRVLSVLPGIEEPERAGGDELAALRDELGIDPDLPIIGTVGRLFPWKGHDRLIRALALLRDRGHEAQGLIVGGGGHRADSAYERSLRELAAELGLDDRVAFTGQVPTAAAYIRLLDVFVNASTPEPFGLVLVEAMALSKPVVAVAAGGPLEIVEDGASGRLVPSGDPEALADGIDELLGDPALRSAMGQRGREIYVERFTAERMAREMEDRLEELAT